MERLSRILLVAAGSVAVGVHAGLAPDHLDEWAPLGASFVAAAALSGLAVVAVSLRPADVWPARALVVVLAGLAGAYVLTRLVALPPLDPDRESLDLTGAITVAVELGGVLAGLHLTGTTHVHRPRLSLDQGGNR
jgi:hypothetical protein